MNIIDIWHIPFEGLADVSEVTLSYEEKTKASKFRKKEDKQRYVLSHVYLRKILSTYFPYVDEKNWEFELSPYGKPSLALKHNVKLYFNLSHSESRAYVVCSKTSECGIDVEEDKAMSLDKNLLELILRPEEIETFNEADFFLYWTLKEAYVKAVGKGLTLPMHTISYKRIKEDYTCGLYPFKNYTMSFVSLDDKLEKEINFYGVENL